MDHRYAFTLGTLMGEYIKIRGSSSTVHSQCPKALLNYGLESEIRSLRIPGMKKLEGGFCGDQDYPEIYRRLVSIYNFHYVKLFPEDTQDRRITEQSPTSRSVVDSLVRMFQRIHDWKMLIPEFISVEELCQADQAAIKKAWKGLEGEIVGAYVGGDLAGSVKYHLSGDGLVGGWKLNSSLPLRKVIVPHMVAKFNSMVESDNAE